MDWADYERHFSRARMGRYLVARSGDAKQAMRDYDYSLRLSAAMLPVINVVEVALRNGVQAQLSKCYGMPDWWNALCVGDAFAWQAKEISAAKERLRVRRELQTPDKVVAELTLGFWNSLFNARLQANLWKPLRLVFQHCPKQQRKRGNISSRLNQIRTLRNRVFHHEPLLWLHPSLAEQHAACVTVVEWMNPRLALWLKSIDSVPSLLAEEALREAE